MQRLGLRGRRYSGTQGAGGTGIEVFDKLTASGVNARTVGRSLFSLPGWLRDMARAGLGSCYVLDMANAHPNIQHRRHPGLTALREYVQNREAVLKKIPGSRDAGKLLFIRLIYGGHWKVWCDEEGVDPLLLPDIVEQFRLDQEQVAENDARMNADLLKTLASEEPGRAGELLQYVLNTQEERRVMDAVTKAVERLGGRVLTPEHDGLFVYAACGAEELLSKTSDAAGYPLTAKACADINIEAAWEELFKKSSTPAELWEECDYDWREREALAREAAVSPLTSHDVFARLLVTEPMISEDVPWPLSDLFKLPLLATNYVWYDAPRHIWVEGGSNGVSRLKAYITQMLQRRLCGYEVGNHLEIAVQRRNEFGNRAFREGVESCLRELLFADQEFHLEPAESLRYLSFEGGQTWDRETESWTRTRPDMLISRSTSWRYQECTHPAKEKVDRALAMVRASQDDRGVHLPSMVPDDAVHILDEARRE